jgi:hypothetical protein
MDGDEGRVRAAIRARTPVTYAHQSHNGAASPPSSAHRGVGGAGIGPSWYTRRSHRHPTYSRRAAISVMPCERYSIDGHVIR